ncbi:uncharacterized protein LOC131061570 isoform X1 [Cryptomeria japonica]|uniref:uncharacterized protein LOC131061570 isoform X1 n=2 Tax=Cryptomeria japonica TaxID=3369 RepID=UPI0025ACA0E0|nr:uncharacterized protein LOC131061570 isoform X1 [Cryptomeria japonica]XP_057851295.1 uncharacterized protein LOC131061570 isoform X1 [Cryptomeria japonica]XP_057851296.1 uncharacterized protein LOC131061570 isoform X1 [Cryptomeria japonica]
MLIQYFSRMMFCEKRMGFGKTDLSKMDMASHEMFSTFLAKTIRFEELGKVGGELLSRFHQELDLFRRQPLNETSQVLENIIQMNQTERLRTYIDAGCRHFHVDAQVTIKLNNSLEGLKKHIEQAQELLKDMECIFNKATSLMNEAISLLMEDLLISEEHSIDGLSGTESNEQGSHDDQKLEISDYVSMMSVVYGMLRQDYAMQEKVVSDLQLDTSSEILQTYCFMWMLRPFVDERIITEALVWI